MIKYKKHTCSLLAGQKAPLFTGIDQNGNEVKLEGFIGKKIIIYFYPKDNTPGCTAQSCNLRDNYNALLEQGYVVIGISPDGEVSHQKFANRFKLPFSLIADEKREIINLYDVWGKKKMFGISYTGLLRTTFLINEKGIIEKVITNVKTLDHSSQILKPN